MRPSHRRLFDFLQDATSSSCETVRKREHGVIRECGRREKTGVWSSADMNALYRASSLLSSRNSCFAALRSTKLIALQLFGSL